MNPIKRVPLVVSGGDNEVVIEVLDMDDGEIGELQDVRQGLSRRDEQVRMLNSLILQLRRELAETRADAERQLTVCRRSMARMNKNLTRLANRPGNFSGRSRRRRLRSTVQLPVASGERRENSVGWQSGRTEKGLEEGRVRTVVGPSISVQEGRAGDSSDEELPRPLVARLCSCPRTLHDLWREYEFGFPGCKPAKDFTISERGKDRYKYYRRNVFWKMVGRMVLAGWSWENACDRVYAVYGRSLSVTKIIACLIRDKKEGGHPELRIMAA